MKTKRKKKQTEKKGKKEKTPAKSRHVRCEPSQFITRKKEGKEEIRNGKRKKKDQMTALKEIERKFEEENIFVREKD